MIQYDNSTEKKELTREEMDLEADKIDKNTYIDIGDNFCKDMFNQITMRIEMENENKDAKAKLE